MSSEVETFVLVAEHGSFSAAARELGVLPSTVSRQMTRLEERLKVRLFHRSTRSVTLTHLGTIYYEGARSFVASIRRLEGLVRDSGPNLRGNVRVAASFGAGSWELPELIASFVETNPDARVSVIDCRSLDEYVRERIDVGIWAGELEDHEWTAKRVTDAMFQLVASPRYLAEYGNPADVEDLETHHFVSRPDQPTAKINDTIDLHLEPRVIVGDEAAVVRFVAQGAGIGIVRTAAIVSELRSGRLVRVLPDLVQASVPVHVLYPRDPLASPTVRAFVDHVTSFFESTREPNRGVWPRNYT